MWKRSKIFKTFWKKNVFGENAGNQHFCISKVFYPLKGRNPYLNYLEFGLCNCQKFCRVQNLVELILYLPILRAEPHSSVSSVANLRTRGRWFSPQLSPIFFHRIDDSHCDRTHSFLTADHCFDNVYVGKQPVAWKEYCVEYWLKELQESMDRCTGHCDITEMLLKTALNTIQSISQSQSRVLTTQKKKAFRNIVGKGKCCNQYFHLFPCFLMVSILIWRTFYLSSANASSLVKFKILSFGKELTFTIQFLVLTTLKKAVENTAGKGENAGNQHFLLFPQCFLFYQR